MTSYAQGDKSPQFDTLSYYLQSEHRQDTSSINWINKQAALIFYQSPDSSRRLARFALGHSIRMSYLKGMAYSYKLIGTSFLQFGHIDSANRYFDMAINLSLQIEDKSLEAKLYNDKAITNAKSNQFVNAMDYFLQSLKINRELADTVLISKCLSNIGLVLTRLELYPSAIPYFQESLLLARQSNKKEIIAGALLSIGTVYYYMGEFANALEVFDEGLRVKEELRDFKGASICFNYKGLIALANDSLAQAEQHFSQSMKLINNIGDQEGLITAYAGLASVSLKKGNVKTAIDYCQKAETLVLSLGVSESYLKVLELYADCYEQSGDFTKSHSYLKKARQLTDSINSKESRQEVVQKSLQYQLENKELQRKIESKKKELILQDKRFSTQLLLLAVVIIILLFLLVLFLLKINRLRRRSQEELEKQQKETEFARKRLENIFTEMMDVVWSERLPDHQTLFFTPSAKDLFETGNQDISSIPGFWRFFVYADDKYLISKMNRETEQNTGFDYTFRIVTKNGRVKWVNNKAKVIRDEYGVALRVDGILRDVSKQKAAELAIIEARKEAEEANITKSRFLANMSHEIRTPLNSVLGFSELLARTTLNETQQEYMHAIQTSSFNLLELLNQVLDFSKIEAGKMELIAVRFELFTFCRQIVDQVKLRAEQKGLHINLRLPQQSPLIVEADELRLRQVLLNLLVNAIKFTEQGHVSLELIVSQGKKGGLVEFKVTDTGIGIGPEDSERLFEAFVQADNTPTRQYGGTGLGLAIVSSLLQLMGSKLHLESEPGKGSSFYFQLILPILDEHHLVKKVDIKIKKLGVGKKLKAIIADDHNLNRSLAARMLHELFDDIQVFEVENGAKALEVWEIERPDLLLLDLQMPAMSGYETAEQLRAFEGNSPQQTIIVALTAGALAGERDRCLAAGMNTYLMKPVSIDAFRHVLSAYFGFTDDSTNTEETFHLWTKLVSYNPKRLQELFIGNLEIIQEVEQMILSGALEKYLDELEGMQSGAIDHEKMHYTAGKLKNASLNAGMERLAAMAEHFMLIQAENRHEQRSVLQLMKAEVKLVQEMITEQEKASLT